MGQASAFNKTIKSAYRLMLEDEGTSVELTDKKSPKEIEDEIKKRWPAGITYRGKEFFDSIYMDILIPFAEKTLGLGTGEGQESYLGYVPESDVFISGWDTFEEEEIEEYPANYPEDGKALYKEAKDNLCFIKLDANFKPSVATEHDDTGSAGMFYNHKNNGYELVKEIYPNRIDIRLD